jgi:hypothetical protein
MVTGDFIFVGEINRATCLWKLKTRQAAGFLSKKNLVKVPSIRR